MKKFDVGDPVVSKSSGRAVAKDEDGKPILGKWIVFDDSTIGVVVGIAKQGVSGYGLRGRRKAMYRVKYKDGVIELPDTMLCSFDNPDDQSVGTKMSKQIDKFSVVKEVALESEPEY